LNLCMHFIFHCCSNFNKTLKRIIDDIFSEPIYWSSRMYHGIPSPNLIAEGHKKLLKHAVNLINEIMKVKEGQFSKIRVLMYILFHQASIKCPQKDKNWILKQGPLALIFEYISRCLEDSSLLGLKVMNGVAMRPTTQCLIDLFKYYCYDRSIESKDEDFKILFKEFINLQVLTDFNEWCFRLVTVDQTLVLEEYQQTVEEYYKKYQKIGDYSTDVAQTFLYWVELDYVAQHLVYFSEFIHLNFERVSDFLIDFFKSNSSLDIKVGKKFEPKILPEVLKSIKIITV